MTKKKFFGGCAIVVVLCIGVTLVVATVSVYLENKEIKGSFGETIAEMCHPPAGGQASKDNLPEAGAAPLKTVVFPNGLPQYHAWHTELPDDLRASGKDDVQIVVCIEELEPKIVEKCEYRETDKEDTLFTIARQQPVSEAVVLNAQTGKRIAELRLRGGMPNECPENYTALEDTTQYFNGKAVEYNDFLTAIEPLLRQ